MNLLEALQCVRGNFIISVGPNRDDILHAKFEDPEQQKHFDIRLDPHIIEGLYLWTVVKMEANANGCDDPWTEITITPWYPTYSWTYTFKDLYEDETKVDLLLKSQNPSTSIFVDGVKYDFADFLTKYVCNHVYADYLCTAFYGSRLIHLYSSVEKKVKALTKCDIDHIKNCRRIDGKFADEKEIESNDT
jgi:hypothetical protein